MLLFTKTVKRAVFSLWTTTRSTKTTHRITELAKSSNLTIIISIRTSTKEGRTVAGDNRRLRDLRVALQTVESGNNSQELKSEVYVGKIDGEKERVSESVEREQRVSDDYLVAPEQDAALVLPRAKAKCGEIST